MDAIPGISVTGSPCLHTNINVYLAPSGFMNWPLNKVATYTPSPCRKSKKESGLAKNRPHVHERAVGRRTEEMHTRNATMSDVDLVDPNLHLFLGH